MYSTVYGIFRPRDQDYNSMVIKLISSFLLLYYYKNEVYSRSKVVWKAIEFQQALYLGNESTFIYGSICKVYTVLN